ncbi:hypothetical protein DFH09DRAFT_1163673 [Mycena vulgaris]|nr:hypothetical protein DFH09DRAFT_1163673 [Mycena vulgaris]
MPSSLAELNHTIQDLAQDSPRLQSSRPPGTSIQDLGGSPSRLFKTRLKPLQDLAQDSTRKTPPEGSRACARIKKIKMLHVQDVRMNEDIIKSMDPAQDSRAQDSGFKTLLKSGRASRLETTPRQFGTARCKTSVGDCQESRHQARQESRIKTQDPLQAFKTSSSQEAVRIKTHFQVQDSRTGARIETRLKLQASRWPHIQDPSGTAKNQELKTLQAFKTSSSPGCSRVRDLVFKNLQAAQEFKIRSSLQAGSRKTGDSRRCKNQDRLQDIFRILKTFIKTWIKSCSKRQDRWGILH